MYNCIIEHLLNYWWSKQNVTQKCSEAIRELESKEIDMDDMESKYSFYIEESRFKKRFDEVNVLSFLSPHWR